MKGARAIVMVAFFVTVLSCFTLGVLHAEPPDLSKWKGTWFKLKMKTKGLAFDGVDFMEDKEKFVAYLKIVAWDSEDGVLDSDLYALDEENGDWEVLPIGLYFHAGTDLKFMCWSEESSAAMTNVFTALVEGVEKEGRVKEGTFQSLGGCYWEEDDVPGSEDRWAGKLSLKGDIIKEKKVPVPPEEIVR